MEQPATIRAVSLDVGGTLIEPWPSVGHVYGAVARQFGAPEIDPELLTANFRQAWKSRERFDYSRAGWREVVDRSFAGVRGFAVTEDCFEAIYERFAEAAAWRVYDDVRPTLTALRRLGLGVALISNWDERLSSLLQALGLDSLAEVIVVSCELGHQKPAREIFEHAAGRLGMNCGEVLHVGDSETEDYAGARHAGMSALWLRRTGCAGEGQIRSLRDLVCRIDGTGQPPRRMAD